MRINKSINCETLDEFIQLIKKIEKEKRTDNFNFNGNIDKKNKAQNFNISWVEDEEL